MRALVLFCHPVPGSFSAALHSEVVSRLSAKGWEVDDCDLYAEEFSPVLTRAEREGYHDIGPNLAPVQTYVARVQAADALVMVYPVWNFGYPAMLKGFFDRVFLPGVSFEMIDGKPKGCLRNVKRLIAVTTYGADRIKATLAGDPPRRSVLRHLRAVVHPRAKARYLALYDMNRATDTRRAAFLARVGREMDRL